MKKVISSASTGYLGPLAYPILFFFANWMAKSSGWPLLSEERSSLVFYLHLALLSLFYWVTILFSFIVYFDFHAKKVTVASTGGMFRIFIFGSYTLLFCLGISSEARQPGGAMLYMKMITLTLALILIIEIILLIYALSWRTLENIMAYEVLDERFDKRVIFGSPVAFVHFRIEHLPRFLEEKLKDFQQLELSKELDSRHIHLLHSKDSGYFPRQGVRDLMRGFGLNN